MTVLTHIPAPEGMAPGIGYTHVVAGSGRFVAISGQIALDADGTVIGADPEAQARQVFANLQRCLAAADATFADVIKLTYFLADVAHLPAIRKVRDEFVDNSAPPASSVVQVAALVRPELLLEIEAIALTQS